MNDYNQPLVLPAAKLRVASAQVIADHERRILYVFPPKCAQTTLRRRLGKGCESPVLFRNAAKYVLEGYQVVMSVRNPYHRIASAHKNKFGQVPFDRLIQTLVSTTDAALDIHFQAQSYLLDRIDPSLYPTAYLRVGPWLAEDVERFAACAGIPTEGELAHDNASGGGKMTPFEDLDEETMALIRHRYAGDFILWEQAHGT